MENDKKISLEKKFHNFKKDDNLTALKNVGQASAIIVGGTILGCALVLPFAAVIYPLATGIEAVCKHQEYLKSFLDKENIQMGLTLYGIGAGSGGGTFIFNFWREASWYHKKYYKKH